MKRVGTITALVALLAIASSGLAQAHITGNHVRPHQLFMGLVNGRPGIVRPVVIKVVCPGPAQTGQTGHPVAGQTVAVIPSATVDSHDGYTGHDHMIGAFLGPLPPSATSSTYVALRHYGVRRRIPTSALFPCSGSGRVTFIPLPLDPTSRDSVVPVVYENVAA
jgi:hypothetical protein